MMKLRAIAALTERSVVRAILAHLDLADEPKRCRHARAALWT